MTKSVYYLTGMGGRLDTGLGQALLARGFDVTGRELVGEFRKLAFNEQVYVVANDLKSNFWDKDARVIANSFGAYLPSCPGKTPAIPWQSYLAIPHCW